MRSLGAGERPEAEELRLGRGDSGPASTSTIIGKEAEGVLLSSQTETMQVPLPRNGRQSELEDGECGDDGPDDRHAESQDALPCG